MEAAVLAGLHERAVAALTGHGLAHNFVGFVGSASVAGGCLLCLGGLGTLCLGVVGVLTGEDVELVDDVEHHVGVQGHVPGIGAHRGVDGAGNVALLAQYVVELEHHGEGTSFQEAL